MNSDAMKMGMAINHIALLVDDTTFQRIKGDLEEIESIALKLFGYKDRLKKYETIDEEVAE